MAYGHREVLVASTGSGCLSLSAKGLRRDHLGAGLYDGAQGFAFWPHLPSFAIGSTSYALSFLALTDSVYRCNVREVRNFN